MKKCYFCNATKNLKAVYVETDDGELEMNKSCCMNCFNNPDHGMEGSPIGATDWFNTDYNWKFKSQIQISGRIDNK